MAVTVPEHTGIFSLIVVPYLLETVAFLIAVVVLVPLFQKMKVSPILGYLGFGALLGPHALSLVNDATDVQHFAELGVVFLLFTIGLELSFERLKAYSSMIFGLGAAHVFASSAAIAAIAFFWLNDIQAAIIIGLCLALSSTAMVVQILTERGDMAARYGRASFSVLLFQDLAVVPILILLSVFGAEDSGSIITNVGVALLKAITAVVFIVIFGRYVLRYLFRTAAKTHSVDVFTALTLLTILATSMFTALAGLSLALGAFLAGLIIAETEFRHQVETEIEPFKGLLLGLFFMGVGMNIDFSVITENMSIFVAAVTGLILVKTLIGTAFGKCFGLSSKDALKTALILAEGGEFAFVILGQATFTYGLITAETSQFLVLVAGISMVLTPLLAILGEPICRLCGSVESDKLATVPNMSDTHDHVIIAGFGRVGKAVAAILCQQSIPYIAIDTDPDNVRDEHGALPSAFVGDASNKELLKKSGIEAASLLLVTMDNPKAAMNTVLNAHQQWPSLPIVVRARDQAHSHQLKEAGATTVVPEILEASLQMSYHVLANTGLSKDQANACIERVRRHDYHELDPEHGHPSETV